MDATLKKLNVKDHDRIVVIGTPPELASLVGSWDEDLNVSNRLGKEERAVLVFVRSCADIVERASRVAATLADDALFWWAYPKRSSKRYDSDIRRDDSWQPLGDLGFEGVRQVTLDDDWSALRFRRPEHIRSMERDARRAMSARGKERTGSPTDGG
jgi:hypothetical protein